MPKKKKRRNHAVPRHDLTGQQFGRFTALAYRGGGRWLCKCSCGNKRKIRTSSLNDGTSKSCGCLRREILRALGIAKLGKWAGLGTHSRTPEYRAFRDARSRCTDEKNNKRNWHNYGGRGIEFRFTDYGQFYRHIGPRPSPEHSLDRINVDGHYEPGNVRWATYAEQMANRRCVFLEEKNEFGSPVF